MSGAAVQRPVPPVAARKASVTRLHGKDRADDYGWMRDPAEPAFRDYLAAERAYYDWHTVPLADLIGRLAAESAGRVPGRAEDSVGWPLSGFIYRTRTPEGRENPQLLRSRSGESREEVLLDENVVGAVTGYVDVAVREPSPDGGLLAWAADVTGAEIYQLMIRDLRTGRDLPDQVERSYPGVAWGAAGDYLFYLVPDQLNRPYQVWRHELGSRPGSDVCVYEEADARFEVELRASRSGQFAVITSASRDTTEVRLVPLHDPLAAPLLVAPRRAGVEYRVDHAAIVTPKGQRSSGDDPARDGGLGWLYIVTDDGEREFTLMRAPASAPGRENWEPVRCQAIAPARADTRLHACHVVGGRLLLELRRAGGAQGQRRAGGAQGQPRAGGAQGQPRAGDGSPLLAITGLDGREVTEIAPSLPAGTIRVEHAEDYHAGSVIIVEESLISPPAWYRLDLSTGERTLLKRREVPGYEPGHYRTERVLATAADGTAIPVTLAYHRQTRLDGTAPCLLYGYGAYEACAEPLFSVGLPSLLDRGVVYAIAHVRGGGECGRNWWQQGRLLAKPTTFTDFIDVADWLAGEGVGGSPALVDGARIVSRGLSAGGLLQGAVYSMRPGRWCAVVAEVPFADCVNTMLDPSIPLTINEWDEWGDPRDLAAYECISSYSPYDNPPPGPRPALLVTGAVHDPRVGVHEPAKWVARLRATGDGLVLFRAELGSGAHTGPSGRFARMRYEAEVHAFVLNAMGITR